VPQGDSDPCKQVAARPSLPWLRCLKPPAAQHLRDIAHYGCADHEDPVAHQSWFVPTLKASSHPTLSALLERVNRLLLFVYNVYDASALTTDIHGDSCRKTLSTHEQGHDHTVVLRIAWTATALLTQRFDACILQMRFHLSINVIFAFSHSRGLRRPHGAVTRVTQLPNAPPPRPPTNPYPTGPYQDSLLQPTTTPSVPERDLTSNLHSSCHRKANKKPPPRPEPTPYPTAPHQSSTKAPNEPPQRPAPNPYPTWPHQS
jgi:hypothetical protein